MTFGPVSDGEHISMFQACWSVRLVILRGRRLVLWGLSSFLCGYMTEKKVAFTEENRTKKVEFV